MQTCTHAYMYDPGSRFAEPPPPPHQWYPRAAGTGPIFPRDCAHFSHMATQNRQGVTRIPSQTQPIIGTLDTFQPRLRHEGINNATVTRIAFLIGPVPVSVDPKTEQYDDDDDDDGDGDIDAAYPEPPHTAAQANPNPNRTTETRGYCINHWGGGGGPAAPGSCSPPNPVHAPQPAPPW